MDATLSLVRNILLLELGGNTCLSGSILSETTFHQWDNLQFRVPNICVLAFIISVISMVVFIRQGFKHIFGSVRSNISLCEWKNWTQSECVHFNGAKYSRFDLNRATIHVIESIVVRQQKMQSLLFFVGCAQTIIGHSFAVDAISVLGFEEEHFFHSYSQAAMACSLIVLLNALWTLVIIELNKLDTVESSFSVVAQCLIVMQKDSARSLTHSCLLGSITQHLNVIIDSVLLQSIGHILDLKLESRICKLELESFGAEFSNQVSPIDLMGNNLRNHNLFHIAGCTSRAAKLDI